MFLYKFFKQYKVKKLYEGTSLKKLIATRWEGHLQTTSAISDNYVELIKCLRQIVNNDVDHGLDGEDVAKATGILTCISKPEFVYIMVFLKDLLEILKPADKILQSREVGYVEAVPVIATVIKEVKKLQTKEKFDAVEKKALQIMIEANVQPRRYPRRTCSTSTTMEDYEKALRDRIESQYFKALDLVLSELNRRFEENDDIF